MKYYNITVNGVAYSVSVEETAAGAAPVAAAAPAAPAAPKAAPAPAAAPKAAAGAAGAVAVKAPMPGNILDVKVKAGASVKAGDPLEIFRVNLESIAKKRKQSLEEAGRMVRREAFDSVCKKYGGNSQRLMVSHSTRSLTI